jgi:hypothetical protein
VYHLERNKAHFTDGFRSLSYRQAARWSPIYEDLCELFAQFNQKLLDEQLPAFPLEGAKPAAD